MAFSPQERTLMWPVELVVEPQEYERAKRAGMSMAGLRDIIDHWMATIADLHPFTNKAVYGARLDGSEKDIFVDTELLEWEPGSPHTKIEVRDSAILGENGSESSSDGVQRCFTSIPFHVVSRSWDDGGDPSFTRVSRVCIMITPGLIIPELSVRIVLETGEEEEVSLHEEGGVIFVDPQQGEIAELVMALAQCEALPALKRMRGKRLKHEPRETQPCKRLFCSCKTFGRQYVNTDMAEFVRCSTTSDQEKVQKLYDLIWHYSMPQYPSLWDPDHIVTCFKFQARLADLASETQVVIQPECQWNADVKEKIKIAEDVSLLLGWQRTPRPETPTEDVRGQQSIGNIPPGCVMQMTKQAGPSMIKSTLDALAAVRKTFVKAESWADHYQKDLHSYVEDSPECARSRIPKRLWNVKENKRWNDDSGQTKYCAVSYVWQQWEMSSSVSTTGDDEFYSADEEDGTGMSTSVNPGGNSSPEPNLERLRRELLKVAAITGIDVFWVDAKCIFQKGDRGVRDKRTELPKMGEYYGAATFTLALLPDVTATLKTCTPIPWQVIDVKAHRKENSELLDQYINCKWMRRIWTMQEAWMARKLVIMTGGKNGRLIRGDYLELLRTCGATIDQYGPLPMCLEWFNTGPSLLIGACTGQLITPGETPTLLTRPAGSALLDDVGALNTAGNGLQARTTTLQRALRLSNGRSATDPKDTLVGLLGMVDRGKELQESLREEDRQHDTEVGTTAPRPPESAFRVAAREGLLGTEIMLCGTASSREGCCWLPRLKDRAASVELPHSSSLVLGGRINVVRGGIKVRALEVTLTEFKVLPRKTVGTGECAWKYRCHVVIERSPGIEATIEAAIESVNQVKPKKQRVLILERTNNKGPFISVRGKPKDGTFYRRKQGFLLFLKYEFPRGSLEDLLAEYFEDRIIG